MEYIQVPAIYIASDRIKTGEEIDRLYRLLEKIDSPTQVVLEAKDIDEVVKRSEWYSKERTGQKKRDFPNVIFSGFDWEDEWNNPHEPKKNREFVPGRFGFADFRDNNKLPVVCKSGYEIHTAFGCLHSCGYCHIGNALTIMLDVEKFIDNLAVLMENNPWQRLYKYDNQSDIMTLEPEYGATKKLVEFFSETDKYLMLYTKSNNVDFLLDLDHKGQTIVCWTLSCEDVVQKFEKGTPSFEERLEAAKKCQEAGYQVRFRFSPIIPVKDWKRKNQEMIERVFSQTKPKVVSLETLCHMSKEQFKDLFGELVFKPQEKVTEYELFSHKDRKELYEFFLREIRKHDSEVKTSLCLETSKMEAELSHLLKQKARFCCCGADCV